MSDPTKQNVQSTSDAVTESKGTTRSSNPEGKETTGSSERAPTSANPEGKGTTGSSERAPSSANSKPEGKDATGSSERAPTSANSNSEGKEATGNSERGPILVNSNLKGMNATGSPQRTQTDKCSSGPTGLSVPPSANTNAKGKDTSGCTERTPADKCSSGPSGLSVSPSANSKTKDETTNIATEPVCTTTTCTSEFPGRPSFGTEKLVCNPQGTSTAATSAGISTSAGTSVLTGTEVATSPVHDSIREHEKAQIAPKTSPKSPPRIIDAAELIVQRSGKRPLHAPPQVMPATIRKCSKDTSAIYPVNRVTGEHSWVKVTKQSFLQALRGKNVRPDLKRLSVIISKTSLTEEDVWIRMSTMHENMYHVPSSIPCARSFVRDTHEILYLEQMHMFLGRVIASSDRIVATDIPLLTCGDCLLGRWWNKFKRSSLFAKEGEWRFMNGVVLCADIIEYELSSTNSESLREEFIQTPDWLTESKFPIGLPVPTPLCAFYFHDELREAMKEPGRKGHTALCLLFQLEWAVQFMATWWHEAARGARGFVLSIETIQWLRERVPEDTPIDAETPHGPDGQTNAAHVLKKMQEISCISSYYHNWLDIAGLPAYRSSFVACHKASADPSNEGVVRLMHRRDGHGKISIMKGQTVNAQKLQRRNQTPSFWGGGSRRSALSHRKPPPIPEKYDKSPLTWRRNATPQEQTAQPDTSNHFRGNASPRHWRQRSPPRSNSRNLQASDHERREESPERWRSDPPQRGTDDDKQLGSASNSARENVTPHQRGDSYRHSRNEFRAGSPPNSRCVDSDRSGQGRQHDLTPENRRNFGNENVGQWGDDDSHQPQYVTPERYSHCRPRSPTERRTHRSLSPPERVRAISPRGRRGSTGGVNDSFGFDRSQKQPEHDHRQECDYGYDRSRSQSVDDQIWIRSDVPLINPLIIP